MRNYRSRRGGRPDSERNVAGVGELRAVAERLLETGAQYLDQGREWLHAATRREQGDDHAPRPDADQARSGFHGERGDAGRADWSTSSRQGSDAGFGGYAPDEYSFSDTGGDFDARTRRGAHDYEDRPAREFDARADDLARSRGTGWDSPREREERARGHYGRQPAGFQPHEDDFLPGSYGFGGEGRRQAGGRAAGRSRDAVNTSSQWEQAYRTQGQGSHRGRGPRGYARSDARILEELNERLCDDPIVDATDIELRCEQGCVVLEGKVPTRWMKHRAEDIADSISGVKDLDNRIRVAAEDPAAHGDFDARTTMGAREDAAMRARDSRGAGSSAGAGSPGSSGAESTGSSLPHGGSSGSGASASASGTGSPGSGSPGQGAQGNPPKPQQPH